MLKKIMVLCALTALVAGCTSKRNLLNAQDRAARMATIAAQGYSENYKLTVLATGLLKKHGSLKNAGRVYLEGILADVKTAGETAKKYLRDLKRGYYDPKIIERDLNEVKDESLKASAVIQAFIANEGIYFQEEKE